MALNKTKWKGMKMVMLTRSGVGKVFPVVYAARWVQR